MPFWLAKPKSFESSRGDEMEKRILYSERVPTFAIMAILFAVALLQAFILYYQIQFGPFGSRPAPNYVLALTILFFLLIGINFSAIRIQLTDVDVRVSYGVFHKTLRWEEIASCEADDQSALRYGGWGVRFGMIRGKKVLVFNTFGGRRAAFITKLEKSRGLVSSTRNRDELMRIAKQMIAMHNPQK
jgi:hypothetical protein